MEDNQQFTIGAFEFQTGHYSCLLHAMGVAMTHCVKWKYADTEEQYDPLQLYRFAEEFDKEHPIEDCSFYMVSAEGAIGVSPGVEYLTKWLFLPDKDEVEVNKIQEDVRQLEAQAKAEEEAKREEEERARQEAEEQARKEAEEQARRQAEEQAKKEAELQAQQVKMEEATPAPATPKAKFCPECGKPYSNPISKFCGNCGAPRKQ